MHTIIRAALLIIISKVIAIKSCSLSCYMDYYEYYPDYLHIAINWDCFGALKM